MFVRWKKENKRKNILYKHFPNLSDILYLTEAAVRAYKCAVITFSSISN